MTSRRLWLKTAGLGLRMLGTLAILLVGLLGAATAVSAQRGSVDQHND